MQNIGVLMRSQLHLDFFIANYERHSYTIRFLYEHYRTFCVGLTMETNHSFDYFQAFS